MKKQRILLVLVMVMVFVMTMVLSGCNNGKTEDETTTTSETTTEESEETTTEAEEEESTEESSATEETESELLVWNGGAEEGLEGWNDWGSNAVDTENVYAGEASFMIEGSNNGGQGWPVPEIKPGATYMLSLVGKCDVKPETPVETGLKILVDGVEQHWFMWFDETEWTYKNVVLTIPDKTDEQPALIFVYKADETAQFNYDNVRLVEVENLAWNGGAEYDIDGWAEWGGISVYTDEEMYTRGEDGLPSYVSGGTSALQVAEEKAGGGAGFSIPLEAGKSYLFSAWARLSAPPEEGKLVDVGAQFHTTDGEHVRYCIDLRKTGWQNILIPFTVPDNYDEASDSNVFVWKASGATQLSFDNVALIEVEDNLVWNGGAEIEMDGWNVWSRVTAGAAEEEIRSGESSFVLGTDGGAGAGFPLPELEPNETYLYSMFVKYAGERDPEKVDDFGMQYTVDGEKVSKHMLHGSDVTAGADKTEWLYLVKAVTMPETWDEGSANVFFWKNDELVKACVDDVCVVKLP